MLNWIGAVFAAVALAVIVFANYRIPKLAPAPVAARVEKSAPVSSHIAVVSPPRSHIAVVSPPRSHIASPPHIVLKRPPTYHKVLKGGKLDGPVDCSRVPAVAKQFTYEQIQSAAAAYGVPPGVLAKYRVCLQ